jgi:hypothetical protein
MAYLAWQGLLSSLHQAKYAESLLFGSEKPRANLAEPVIAAPADSLMGRVRFYFMGFRRAAG